MLLVIKFGGETIRDGKRVKNAAKFVVERHRKGDKLVVVTSAISTMTDQLIEIAQKITRVRGSPKRLILDFLKRLSSEHFRVCRAAISDKNVLSQTTRTIENELHNLERALVKITHCGELSPRLQDLAMSFGERLSAPILAGAIQTLGVPSRHLTGLEAGIVTNGRHLEARPLLDQTRRLIRRRLRKPLEGGDIPVVTGFVAGTRDGVITTLGRGGSDYSASLIGSALEADEIWIMTDVDGIMTTDPKIEPNARVVREISYLEATELAYFGAQVLHPKTIEPAMDLNIPVRIKNAFNPEGPGTLVVRKPKKIKRIVKAITASREVAIVTVGGPSMVGAPGVAAEVFHILGKAGIKVLMISQSSSQANISFIVERKDLKLTLRVLRSEFTRRRIDWSIDYDKRASVIATVGAGMRGTPGVAARVFNTMGLNDINIFMISQGSSELNISFSISEKDVIKAVRALHTEFNLSKAGN